MSDVETQVNTFFELFLNVFDYSRVDVESDGGTFVSYLKSAFKGCYDYPARASQK